MLLIWLAACGPACLGPGQDPGAGALSDGSGSSPSVSPKSPGREAAQLSSGKVRLWGPRRKEYSGHSRRTKLPFGEATAVSGRPRGRQLPTFSGRPCSDHVSCLGFTPTALWSAQSVALRLGHFCISLPALRTLSEVRAVSKGHNRCSTTRHLSPPSFRGKLSLFIRPVLRKESSINPLHFSMNLKGIVTSSMGPWSF